MAEEDQIPADVEKNIDQSLGGTGMKPKRTQKLAPSYKVVGSSKIPVSKAHGSVWKSRQQMAIKASKDVRDAWDEAINYFENDHAKSRLGDGSKSANNRAGGQRLNNALTETENVVFANVTTMVPALYARNPRAEFTATCDESDRLATTCERLVNALGRKKSAPGINFKPKARRCIVTTLLTNRAWIKVGWTFKDDSTEKALADLKTLSDKLVKAKTNADIAKVEGEIEALEQSIDILQPSGPSVTVRPPHMIHIDPNGQEVDLTDAKWVIEDDFLPTEFILARYGKQTSKDSSEYKSLYKSSHILKIGVEADQAHDEDNFSLFDEGKEYKDFGYDSKESFDKAKMTKVAWVWDKVTRRLFLYNQNDWTWPLWVWDDPLQLDTFFPYFPLTFFESPKGPLTKGEVTYYLDQQDAINDITDEQARIRAWGKRNVFFNSNLVSKEDVEVVLKGPDGTARGLNIPEGMKLNDVIGTITPPSIQISEMFDKEDKYKTIDRISSVGDVLRGAQFKTNTTNDAVQASVGSQNMRVDEKTDNIEDWTGQIYWAVAQLCLMHMDQKSVASIIGQQEAAEWKNMSAEDIQSSFSVTVVGGSTKKPTSQAKKEEALEMGQVLGQFVNTPAAPVVLRVMLEVLQEAFDEVTIAEEDWTTIMNAVAPEETGVAPAQGGPAPEQAGKQVTPEQLEQILAQLPPEMKEQVAAAIEQGVNPEQALEAGVIATQQLQ